MVTLTFWEGLELGAALQVELLQVTELTCTCKTITQSENSTVPLRAEALGLPGYQALKQPCRNAPSGRDWSCLQLARVSIFSAAQLPMAAKQSQDQTFRSL